MSREQWRRQRSVRPLPCDHLHEATTRYDHVAKLLTFLLVCPVCRSEKVIETCQYEPRFQPHRPAGPARVTLHQLPVQRSGQATRRAA
jgi:hypothetical protein